MSAAEMPLSIDLNIDRMRAVITKEMAEACKPFMKRLEQLDHVEAFLKAEQAAMLPPRNVGGYRRGHALRKESYQKKGWQTRRKRGYKDAHGHLVLPADSPQALLSGGPSGGIYAHATQGDAILDIVGKEPGLDVPAITERLVDGGYPFKGKRPIDAMVVALRHASRKGQIQQVTPARPGKGERIRYYPVEGVVAGPPKSRVFGALTESIIAVIADGPTSGMTRMEVFEALLSAGFHFTPGLKNPPERHISWTLQSLVDSQRIQKTGMGAGALFSRPKLTAFKK